MGSQEETERKNWNATKARGRSVRAARRMLVVRLYLRGMSMREIRLALAAENVESPRPGQVNPKGRPWGLATIHRDVKAAEEDWEKRAAADIGERRQRLVAELREHRREAWRLKRLAEVRLGITAEAKLDGLEHPQGVDVTSGGGRIPIQLIRIHEPPAEDDEE